MSEVKRASEVERVSEVERASEACSARQVNERADEQVAPISTDLNHCAGDSIVSSKINSLTDELISETKEPLESDLKGILGGYQTQALEDSLMR